MTVYLKIAFRNILKNKKRTALIGLTLAISCVMLFFSFSIGNGIQRQIIGKYRDFQSGDVSVVWSNVKKIDINDPSRLFFSNFEYKRDKENRQAINRLDEFLDTNGDKVEAVYKSVTGNGMMDTGKYAAYSTIYGLSEEEAGYLQTKGILQLTEGDMTFMQDYGVCISDAAAEKYDIAVGDWVTLDSSTASGYVNTLEYQVTGLYKSSSDFDSIYVYMSRENALELFDQDTVYFQNARIYLDKPENAEKFAGELDAYLTSESGVLRAESITYSSTFYSMITGFLKMLFAFFVVFIMFIIAIGIRSVVRMNLFERMKEFGTLRAIGFNRLQSFLIIFLEIFILSLFFFGAAFVANLLLILLLGSNGIYTGKGAVAYALGGESIRPVFAFSDTFLALGVMTGFSLFAPLKPGLRLCYQKITDMLAQNQKPVSAIGSMIKNAIFAGKKLRQVHQV
ncbi:MAG: ABC transporter permease [Ruminiclostridium sp.]|nr:ABC transporter permease [Ruminiclostridium sp.]